MEFPIGQIIRQFPDVVKKAGGLDDDGFSGLFDDEHLIADRIVRLIGVQADGAEIVNTHPALGKTDLLKHIFVHCLYLLNSADSGSLLENG